MNGSAENRVDAMFDRTPPGPTGAVQWVSPTIRRVVAPNPGPFTFSGTCVYIVGRGQVAVIDPGPDDPGHVGRLIDVLKGEDVAFILATHTHADHSPACAPLRAATGGLIVGCAPMRPPDGAPPPRSHDLAYAPDRVLGDGESVDGPGFTLTALATPGHASNHLAFVYGQEKALFSGDVVMAWSTTVIAPPDGNMAAYMRSLELLSKRDDDVYWPGHGGPVREPRRFVRALASHRRHRELLIARALEAGDRTVDALVERLYVGLDPRLRGGAARSVLAHLEDLVARGLVRCDGPPNMAAQFAPAEPRS
jgi:glyoxylase-like metal-dependent hydrolase (beta-lactamase superfamily II)